jgi:hypothetical protein
MNAKHFIVGLLSLTLAACGGDAKKPANEPGTQEIFDIDGRWKATKIVCVGPNRLDKKLQIDLSQGFLTLIGSSTKDGMKCQSAQAYGRHASTFEENKDREIERGVLGQGYFRKVCEPINGEGPGHTGEGSLGDVDATYAIDLNLETGRMNVAVAGLSDCAELRLRLEKR